MNKTRIEWCDYTWNPLVGCMHGCSFCYARRFARRAKCPKCRDFFPHDHPERLHDPERVRKPSRVFVLSMGDPADFVPAVPSPREVDLFDVIEATGRASWHRYYLLTKRPEALKSIEFPEWWTVGVSVGESAESWNRIEVLRDVVEAEHKFVSVEPLLVAPPDTLAAVRGEYFAGLEWVIMGAQTGPGARPVPQDAARAVVYEADEGRTPLFVKDSLLRQRERECGDLTAREWRSWQCWPAYPKGKE